MGARVRTRTTTKSSGPTPMALVAQVDTSALEEVASRLAVLADKEDAGIGELKQLVTRLIAAIQGIRMPQPVDHTSELRAMRASMDRLASRVETLEAMEPPAPAPTEWRVVRGSDGRVKSLKGR